MGLHMVARNQIMARPKKAVRGAKSQAIRDHFASNKKATSAEVAAALKEQGISVSSQMVSNIKGKLGLTTKRRRRQVAVASRNGNGRLSIDDLMKASKLVKEIGAERAKEAINA